MTIRDRLAAVLALPSKTHSDIQRQSWAARRLLFCDGPALFGILDQQPTQVPAGWISVVDRLPESGKPVIVNVVDDGRKPRQLRAEYAASKTLESSMESDDGEYDETTDTYYCPQGWYETNEAEEIHWYICGQITHWMPLPAAPDAKENGNATDEGCGGAA